MLWSTLTVLLSTLVPALATPVVPIARDVAPAAPVTKRWDHPVAAPKVFIISMFTPEDVWTTALDLNNNITLPGLSPLFPNVRCNAAGEICHFITGEGEINAAASVTALLGTDALDLTQTYFLIAGIAGVNPNFGTLGTAGLARYAVQVALAHELDAREMPEDWPTGYFLQGTKEPNVVNGAEHYGTEVFELNTNLRERVRPYTEGLTLNDTEKAQAFRAKYSQDVAKAAPTVIYGDVSTSDVYFAGELLCQAFANITKLWTNGTGEYVFTAQEDNATFEVFVRYHLAGLVDFARVILLRTGSDFDRAPPGMSAYEGFVADQGGFPPALQNLFVVGNPIVQGIISDWDEFEGGIAPQDGWLSSADVLHTLDAGGARQKRSLGRYAAARKALE